MTHEARSRRRRLSGNQWTPSLVTLVLSIAFSLTFWFVTRPHPIYGVGDPVTIGDFDFTVTSLACRAARGTNPHGDQVCLGTLAIVNEGRIERPPGARLWLVSSDGRRFQATASTSRALDRPVDPGDAVFVPIEFTPPSGLVFEALEVVVSGDSASIGVFVGEGMSPRRAARGSR